MVAANIADDAEATVNNEPQYWSISGAIVFFKDYDSGIDAMSNKEAE